MPASLHAGRLYKCGPLEGRVHAEEVGIPLQV